MRVDYEDKIFRIKNFCKNYQKNVDNCGCILYIITNKNHYQ